MRFFFLNSRLSKMPGYSLPSNCPKHHSRNVPSTRCATKFTRLRTLRLLWLLYHSLRTATAPSENTRVSLQPVLAPGPWNRHTSFAFNLFLQPNNLLFVVLLCFRCGCRHSVSRPGLTKANITPAPVLRLLPVALL